MSKGAVKFSYTFKDIGPNGETICLSDSFDVHGLTKTEVDRIFTRFKSEILNSCLGLGNTTTEDLRAIFGVTTNTIQNWVKRDGMPIVAKDTKGYKFDRDQVFNWVKENKNQYAYLIKRYLDRVNSQK